MLKSSIAPHYSERRKKLMAQVPEGCFIFFGASEISRNGHNHYAFRQNSHFYYLSEFTEPGAIMVLTQGKSILFCSERIEAREVWDGEFYGPDRAKTIFQFDETYPLHEFERVIDEKLAAYSTLPSAKIYYQLGSDRDHDQKIHQVVSRAKKHFGNGNQSQLPIFDPSAMLSKLRMVKDSFEIDRLRKAAQLSVKAHRHLMSIARPGMNESELFNEFQYTSLKNGGTDLGYGAIVAGGWNATTLHYNHNNEVLKAGDLILIDAGAEGEYYTADITQTFPVSSRFSEEQKIIYQIVLDTSREITKLMRPGATYRQLQARTVELLTEALIKLGILKGTAQENIDQKLYRPYYPHGVGHHLGIDVHDSSLYEENGKDFLLTAGMVMTVEPGLYFREKGNRFYGIGVRIEDNVLITDAGPEVLTRDLPREIKEIEAIRAGELS